VSASDVLQSLRARGYSGGNQASPQGEQQPSADRILSLSDEEMQAVQPEPGKEICLSVYGVMDKDGFHVSRIEPDQADENNITPEDVMGAPPSRAMPSPS
jgi:hypothetical protein